MALRDLVGGTRVEVVPNGVELPPRPLTPARGTDVVFVGTMDYAPNAEAVSWFLRRVWEGVREAVPSARFRIIGRGARERFPPAAGVDRIGYVSDVPEACGGARLAVVPLWAGLGIKTKTLEFLGMGLPVVATSVGAEGLPTTEGLVVADDPGAFREAVVRLLTDPQDAALRGRAGRAVAAEGFGWDAAAAVYRELLVETVEAGRETEVGR